MAPGRLDASDLAIPYPGVRAPADADFETVDARAEQFAERMRPWQFFSHSTALALYGAPIPGDRASQRLHVAAHRPDREPRVAGVVGHRLGPATHGIRLVDGLRVEEPARAWRHVASSWGHADLAAAGDFLVGARGLLTLDDLAAELAAGRGRGQHALEAAFVDVRVGAESPTETRLRLVLGAAGLPEPALNTALRAPGGRFVARLDLSYEQWRVAVEYDGRQHAEDRAQFERDSDRWHDIREQGWVLVRVLRHHLLGEGRAAVGMVQAALRRAGWPG
ncbi:endonuclease domain-containing protein [Microbacterium sp. EYE_5]|uniref:endonuclease domain-containing protein n=1 Tax=unclassified Microbacterium TaxID=2609290 RepID=UPI002002A128|nr:MULTISPECIES: endonuclease domain-containing protein [unclassified Microbacterium]MCK6081559.1 endonuclease domain-containing protein [Microbacterium sp. EYE_382]MCK6086829.1 endonuclease domain-containing protein [Microbacterium sp. EYE_384]MCK6123673.1 endonuclease domain-containing protein [Microbacterium sp. EYE_80]MCK6126582.1 endonuclease domain-containing protein [Microbacterium sp. EYE_79]MCK6142513.1 endonuclease domain-containing protein [Microbacterium sp. EYE_39]